jgi:putative transposase
MSLIHVLYRVFFWLVAPRKQLVLENLALRQQLAVFQRSGKVPMLRDRDRMFWIVLKRWLPKWKQALFVVQPETVIGWHRRGFRSYWRRKSASRPGRPCIERRTMNLIRRLSQENHLWGAPRIRSELALLGHPLSEATVAKYMARRGRPKPSQSWRTFLANHLCTTAACDFFVVPTLTFKVLYVFVILSHDRRRILHFNVTAHPTATWTGRQLIEAFPYSSAPGASVIACYRSSVSPGVLMAWARFRL